MATGQTGYKGSLTKRLNKQTLDFLGKYSSDCNEAAMLIEAEIAGLKEQLAIKPSGTAPSQGASCRFDEKQFHVRLRPIIKEAMEEVLAPFVGK